MTGCRFEGGEGVSGEPLVETRYDPNSEDQLAIVIVRSVATAANVDPLDLDQRLYEVIDPDALAQLFPEFGERGGTSGRVAFDFCDHTVVVHSDGWIEVYD